MIADPTKGPIRDAATAREHDGGFPALAPEDVGKGVADRKLTIKQERFARHYVANGGDGRKAYKFAYAAQNMTNGSVDVEVNRLKLNPRVALRIQQLEDEALHAAQVTPEWVVGRIKDRAETTASDQVAMRGYELLGKAVGLLRPDGVRVQVNVASIGSETRQLIGEGKLALDELGGDAEPRLWSGPPRVAPPTPKGATKAGVVDK